MMEENLGNTGPGCDVFSQRFVVFATMDGDAFCFDVLTNKEPEIVLFGHEGPLDLSIRKQLLQEKGKVVAPNLADFFERSLNETLDRQPRY
jgi:hypothetical protein